MDEAERLKAELADRDKAIAGVRKALKGRNVPEDVLAILGQDVEDALRAAGSAEIDRGVAIKVVTDWRPDWTLVPVAGS